jgi:hypothetical protein
MCMELISTIMLPRCYKATVNESETITEAQAPFAVGRLQPAACLRFPVFVPGHIERS